MKNIFRGEKDADAVLVQPVDDHDLAGLDSEYAYIRAHSTKKVFLAAVLVDDWNTDLSPWEAPPVFGKEAFGAGAADTLRSIQNDLLPLLPATCPLIIGGYSLAGLFALWSVYQTDIFAACAAASPSVWFPGWMDYAAARTPKAGAVYLSLGDREKKARNPLMATVADCIKKQDALLGVLPHTLEWNPGNHFFDNDIRMAKGFVWAMDHAS